MRHSSVFLLAAAMAVGGLVFKPHDAQAAQSYSNCTGFVDSLPATISAPGTWCLKKDLSTAMTTGRAISIAADDVILDCNDFKIGGLGAGPGSTATGVASALNSPNRNTTIRNCNIRGFATGIALYGGGGHLVEHNRMDNNLYGGIVIEGLNNDVHKNNLVRHNIIQTIGGGTSQYNDLHGIHADADIHDNLVANIETHFSGPSLYGIRISGVGTVASNNTIRGMSGNDRLDSPGRSYGILADSARVRLDGNHIVGNTEPALGAGIRGSTNGAAFCIGNTVARFTEAIGNCQIISANSSY